MRSHRERLRRAERRASALPGCSCSDPGSRRVHVLEHEEDGRVAYDADPGPCPRCGAPPLRILILTTVHDVDTEREGRPHAGSS